MALKRACLFAEAEQSHRTQVIPPLVQQPCLCRAQQAAPRYAATQQAGR